MEGERRMILAESIISRYGLAFTSRWLHIVFGIMWIGLLYYFNFVQVPAFAKFGNEGDGPRARNIAIDKLASRALWACWSSGSGRGREAQGALAGLVRCLWGPAMSP